MRGGGHSKTCLKRRWGPKQIVVDCSSIPSIQLPPSSPPSPLPPRGGGDPHYILNCSLPIGSELGVSSSKLGGWRELGASWSELGGWRELGAPLAPSHSPCSLSLPSHSLSLPLTSYHSLSLPSLPSCCLSLPLPPLTPSCSPLAPSH